VLSAFHVVTVVVVVVDVVADSFGEAFAVAGAANFDFVEFSTIITKDQKSVRTRQTFYDVITTVVENLTQLT